MEPEVNNNTAFLTGGINTNWIHVNVFLIENYYFSNYILFSINSLVCFYSSKFCVGS